LLPAEPAARLAEVARADHVAAAAAGCRDADQRGDKNREHRVTSVMGV
jgi:hypothetical protein